MKFFRIFLIYIINISISVAFSGKGTGTIDDPFQIININQLQEIKNDEKANYILMNDIDASETRYWNFGDHDGDTTTPYESMGFEPIFIFSGSLNGNGHLINDLYINRPVADEVSFIIKFNGQIKKLGFENCEIIGGHVAGCLFSEYIYGKIEECYTTGKVITIDTSGNCYSGGFGVISNVYLIKNSYSSCTVISYNKSDSNSDFYVASFCNGVFLPFYNAEYCYTIGKVISLGKGSAFSPDENALNCYWDVDSTGIPDSGGHAAKGLHTPEMKKRATYVGWDFDSVWCIDEGRDYPRLRVFGKCKPESVHEGQNQTDNKFTISPNPASSLVKISYSVPSYSFVRLSVFDIFGNEVDKIISEYQTPGSREASFDSGSLADGMYFVRLCNGTEQRTGKFVKFK